MTTIIAIFFILHGLVHLLYMGQSLRRFELKPKMIWPDESWAFARLLGTKTTRLLAGISLILAAAGFVSGGFGLLIQQDWWRSLVVASAIFSSLLFLLLWNGKLRQLDDQGWVGILINIAVGIAVLILRWPA